MNLDPDCLRENLALTMYMAAASAAADSGQREQLRVVVAQLAPLYKAGEVQPEAFRRAVRKVLGPDWRPGPAWRRGFWADRIDG